MHKASPQQRTIWPQMAIVPQWINLNLVPGKHFNFIGHHYPPYFISSNPRPSFLPLLSQISCFYPFAHTFLSTEIILSILLLLNTYASSFKIKFTHFFSRSISPNCFLSVLMGICLPYYLTTLF